MRLALLPLVLAACSSNSATQTPSSAGVKVTNNGCMLPKTGMFLGHFVEKGGSCGPVPDLVLDGADSVTCPQGSGTITNDPVAGGGCKVSFDLTGCVQSGGAVTAENGTDTWSADYSMATGTETVHVMTSAQSCIDTYDVTLTKQ